MKGRIRCLTGQRIYLLTLFLAPLGNFVHGGRCTVTVIAVHVVMIVGDLFYGVAAIIDQLIAVNGGWTQLQIVGGVLMIAHDILFLMMNE